MLIFNSERNEVCGRTFDAYGCNGKDYHLQFGGPAAMKENKRGWWLRREASIVGLILLVAGALVGWYLLGKHAQQRAGGQGKLFGIRAGRWLWC